MIQLASGDYKFKQIDQLRTERDLIYLRDIRASQFEPQRKIIIEMKYQLSNAGRKRDAYAQIKVIKDLNWKFYFIEMMDREICVTKKPIQHKGNRVERGWIRIPVKCNIGCN